MPAFEYDSSDGSASERDSSLHSKRRRRRSKSSDNGLLSPPAKKHQSAAASSSRIVVESSGRPSVLEERPDAEKILDNDDDLLPDDRDPADTVPKDRPQFLSQVDYWFNQLDSDTKAKIQLAMNETEQRKPPPEPKEIAFSNLTEQEVASLTEDPEVALNRENDDVDMLFTTPQVADMLDRTAGGLELSRAGLAKLSKRFPRTGDTRADKYPVTENLFENFRKFKTVDTRIVRFMDRCMAQVTETVNLARRPLLRTSDLVQKKINDGQIVSFQEAEARTASNWALRALAHAQYQLQALRRIANLAPIGVSVDRFKSSKLEPLINAPIEKRSESERYTAGADVKNAAPLLCSHTSLKLLHEHGKSDKERTTGLAKGLGLRAKPEGDSRFNQRPQTTYPAARSAGYQNRPYREAPRYDYGRERYFDSARQPSNYGNSQWGGRGGGGAHSSCGGQGRGRGRPQHDKPRRPNFQHRGNKGEDK